MKKIVYLVISMFIFLSCNKSLNEKVSMIDLEPSMEIEELSDSTFFRGIYSMIFSDCIYAVDEFNGRILKLDTNLNLLNTIGRIGQGPQELAGIGCIGVWKDTLLAINVGGKRLNTYSAYGQFIESHLFDDIYIAQNNFCIDDEGFLYFTSIIDSFPIVKYDRNMNRQFSFGNWIEPDNKDFRRYLNDYHIAFIDNKIITVQTDAPIINMYDKDGKHLLKKELPEQLFKKRLMFKKTEQEKDAANMKKIYKLFSCISTIDNKIYLPYIDHDDEQNIPYINKVVEIIFKNNDFIINKVYVLSRDNKGWFNTIVITNSNKIIASNPSLQMDPTISVFQMP